MTKKEKIRLNFLLGDVILKMYQTIRIELCFQHDIKVIAYKQLKDQIEEIRKEMIYGA